MIPTSPSGETLKRKGKHSVQKRPGSINAHLRHVTSRAISWHIVRNSLKRRAGQVQEGKIEGKIDKGREGWNTHGPSGTVLYFKPGCERIEGLGVNQSRH